MNVSSLKRLIENLPDYYDVKVEVRTEDEDGTEWVRLRDVEEVTIAQSITAPSIEDVSPMVVIS